MTFFEDKIQELKKFSAKHFGTSVDRISDNKRTRTEADARKCIVYLAHKHYPEVRMSKVLTLINRERYSQRKILFIANILMKQSRSFRIKVNLVESEITKKKCPHCREIVNYG